MIITHRGSKQIYFLNGKTINLVQFLWIPNLPSANNVTVVTSDCEKGLPSLIFFWEWPRLEKETGRISAEQYLINFLFQQFVVPVLGETQVESLKNTTRRVAQ